MSSPKRVADSIPTHPSDTGPGSRSYRPGGRVLRGLPQRRASGIQNEPLVNADQAQVGQGRLCREFSMAGLNLGSRLGKRCK